MLECPNCLRELTELEYKKIKVDRCDNCGGIWLDSGELRTLKVDEDSPIDENVRIAPKETKIQRKCPKDKTELYNKKYAYDTEIMIDQCPFCGGIFLDQNELDSIGTLLAKYHKEIPSDYAKWKEKLDNIESDYLNDQEKVLDDVIRWDFLKFDDILRFLLSYILRYFK